MEHATSSYSYYCLFTCEYFYTIFLVLPEQPNHIFPLEFCYSVSLHAVGNFWKLTFWTPLRRKSKNKIFGPEWTIMRWFYPIMFIIQNFRYKGNGITKYLIMLVYHVIIHIWRWKRKDDERWIDKELLKVEICESLGPQFKAQTFKVSLLTDYHTILVLVRSVLSACLQKVRIPECSMQGTTY